MANPDNEVEVMPFPCSHDSTAATVDDAGLNR
jgi:hypothetical protein